MHNLGWGQRDTSKNLDDENGACAPHSYRKMHIDPDLGITSALRLSYSEGSMQAVFGEHFNLSNFFNSR